MANDYYTLDQVCEILGLSAADVKTMVADGRLHELRDAGRIFFRQSEVDKMAAKEGSSIVDLVADDDAAPTAGAAQDPDSFASALSSLADSSSSLGLGEGSPGVGDPAEMDFAADVPSPGATGPGGSGMGISPIDLMSPEDFPVELPAVGAKPAELSSEIDLLPTGGEEDASILAATGPAEPMEVPDLGLSGSSIINLQGAGEEELMTPAPKPTGKPAGKGGISVFDDDELDIPADPMGETRISAGVDELDTVGSGSGLLDLTQVSDDTSLGAELLDVISPSAEAADTETEEPVVEAAETVEDSGAITASEEEEEGFPSAATAGAPAVALAAPRMAAYSAMRGGTTLNVSILLGVICLAALGLAAAGAVQGVWPGFLNHVASGVVHYSVFGGLAFVAILTGVLSILADRK